MNMNDGRPDRTNARAEAPAKLTCHEVREDIVAIQRDELSPLRTESIRLHLASCAECREEALSLELAARDYAKLPELIPPTDLVAITMRRVASEGVAKGMVDRGVVVEQARSPAPRVDAAPTLRRTTSARILVARGTSILRRHVSNPFIRVAVAAVLFIGVMLLRNEKVEDAAGRAQRRLLGTHASEDFDEARDAFLERLRL